MKNNAKRGWYVIGLCLAVGGCTTAEKVNVGNTAVLGAQLTDYAGTWQGYAEAYAFSDGKDTVRLKLSADGSGALDVGEAAAVPVATDPDSLFPGSMGDPTKPITGKLVSGFKYPVYEATVDAQRIRLKGRLADLYKTWCGLQTPQRALDASSTLYNCIGGVNVNSDETDRCLAGSDHHPFPCEKMSCQFLCRCTETSCDIAEQFMDIQIDGALQAAGEELVGTLVAGGERIIVRLMRK